MAIPVKIQVFEGPLDLLLHLIEKNKINIYDIPIVEITKQYLDYVNAMQKSDLNVVSEFLVMAATLIDIKSKMLLPAEVDESGEEIDPRAELVERLLEYEMYKYMSYELKDRQVDANRSLYKQETVPDEIKAYKEPVNLDDLLHDITLKKLHEIFKDVMRRQENKVDPIRSNFGKIEKEEVNLEEKMEYVKEYASTHQIFSFKNLLEKQASKMQIIVTFLAILELMKMGEIIIEQAAICSDILICRKRKVN